MVAGDCTNTFPNRQCLSSAQSNYDLSTTSPIDAVETTCSNYSFVDASTVNRLKSLQDQIKEVHPAAIPPSGVGCLILLGVLAISLGILSVLLSVVITVSSLSVGRIFLSIVLILGIGCVLSTTHILSIIRILSIFSILRISCLVLLVLLGIIVVPNLGIRTISCVLLSAGPCSILRVFCIILSIVIDFLSCSILGSC